MVNTQLAFFSMNTESNYNVKSFFSYGNSVCTKYPIHDTLKYFWKRFFSGCNFEPLFINLHNVNHCIIYIRTNTKKSRTVFKKEINAWNTPYLMAFRCMMLVRCSTLFTVLPNESVKRCCEVERANSLKHMLKILKNEYI